MQTRRCLQAVCIRSFTVFCLLLAAFCNLHRFLLTNDGNLLLTSTSIAKEVSSGNDDASTLSLEEQIRRGTATALTIARNEFPLNNLTSSLVSVAEWQVDLQHILNYHHQHDTPCLVYSFGVGSYDAYTEFMAKYCHVFAFEPSIDAKTPYTNYPNVTFVPYGLGTSKSWSHPTYGRVPASKLLSLPDIMHRLGHDDGLSVIAAIKFDCEGCEVSAFQDIQHVSKTPILSFHTEFHFATTLGMESMDAVAGLAVVDQVLRERRCRVDSYRPNRGFRRDRHVYPYLVEKGVPDGVCCYEYTFSCEHHLEVPRMVPWGY